MKIPYSQKTIDIVKRGFSSSWIKASRFIPPKAGPDELLGELFHDVQLLGIHPDSKAFTDLVSNGQRRRILKAYQKQRHLPDFNLDQFVKDHFKPVLNAVGQNYQTAPNTPIEEHINLLWTALKRENYEDKGSLMALPHPYIVPGGRFSEQFYWDSYFIMLGLASANRYTDIENMLKNAAYLVQKVGYIPTGNRTYFTSRSQPPFFTHMVRLLAAKKGKIIMIRYLPLLLNEYRFWMKGRKQLTPDLPAKNRVVLMPDGSVLNRYWDSKATPRADGYREDTETAQKAKNREPEQVYRDIRAACESGWDFSSRWLDDSMKLETIHTTDFAPVDLNCLLLQLERIIADIYELLKQPLLAKRYRKKEQTRAAAIQKYCWSETEKFYFDYNFKTQKISPRWTLAGVFPIYARVSDAVQAQAVANHLKAKFLQPGGLLTTPIHTGQQWDSPNGWAPLQWIAIQGLRDYNHHELASIVKSRWIKTNLEVFKTERKLVEKYNVVNPGLATGGEYILQDGFGWTNGVLAALLAEKEL